MSGAVALHGGGEFLAGDEPFLAALLGAARERVGDARAIRVVVVPTAAARGRPDLAAANGVAAFEGAARTEGTAVAVEAVGVVDGGSAVDPGLVGRLAAADVIHFPGGDPDLIPTLMHGSAAWTAVETALQGGAVLAGASAGAMALAPWTWTPGGGVVGLGVVAGLFVVPHADGDRWASALQRFGGPAPVGLGAMGLAERTGVITGNVAADPIAWRVVGPGEVRWQAVRGSPTIVVRSGETLETPRGRS
jgi:cyanophycinase